MEGVRERLLVPGSRAPLVFEPTRSTALAVLISEHHQEIRGRLLEHGALLFRGFSVRSTEDFGQVADAISSERMPYVYRSTPRTALGEAIFSATEYPPPLEIPPHSENAYQKKWPLLIAFCCLVPAQAGGETPIAEMRKVTTAVDSGLLAKFAAEGVRYIRHYHSNVDLPWQTVFQTTDVSELGRFCKANDIEHEWLEGRTLRTVQVAQGTARHPSTGENLFFNQAHLFHVSSVGEDAAESLIELYGRHRLPRHATFGSGAEISMSELDDVRNAFKAAAVSFPWMAGDVLLLDNMQIAHGRHPFKGPRRVITTLLNPYSVPAGS